MHVSDALTLGSELGLGEDEFREKLRSREKRAVNAVIRKYTPILYRTSLRYGLNEEHADEVVQNTWEAFFSALPRFEGRSQVRTFLIGILLNKAREFRRAGNRYQASEDIDRIVDEEFDAAGNWTYRPAAPDAFAEALQTERHLKECLDKVSETHRMALFLKEQEAENPATICKILSISETNLGVMIHRAKKTLRRCLEQKALGFGG